jgi:hypothetical protein
MEEPAGKRGAVPAVWGLRQRGLTVVLLLGALLLLLLLARPVFSGRMYVEDDLGCYHLPLRAFYHECLQKGDSPVWMPYIFCGYYLHGDGNIGMYHPLHYLIYRLLPFSAALMTEFLLNYGLIFAGFLLLLRRWHLPPHAALFGAILATFIGYPLNHYIDVSMMGVLALTPWLLWLIDVAMRSGERPYARAAAVLGVLGLTALQQLAAFPQSVLFSALIEGILALFLFARTRNLRVLLLLGAAKGLGVFCGAVQLLPTMDVLAESYRAEPTLDYQISMSLHPYNLLQSFNPYLFHRRVFARFKGDEPWDAPYLSAAAPALLALLMTRWRDLEKNRRAYAALALSLAVLGLLLALGRYGFLYHIYRWIPFVNKFRAPARYLYAGHVGMALAAAFAFAPLTRTALSRRGDSWPRLIPVMLVPLASLAATLFLVWRSGSPDPPGSIVDAQLQSWPRLIFGMGLVTAASLLVLLSARGWPLALTALVLFTFADTGFYSMRNKPMQTPEEYLADIPEPPGERGARIDSDIHPFFVNRFNMKDYRCVFGYTSFPPVKKLDITKESVLRLAGVSWRETRVSAGGDAAAAWQAGKAWIPLENPMPRARLVSHARASSDPAADLPAIDMARTALVPAPLALDAGARGDAEIVSDRPGNIRISAETNGRMLLILSESYHPGWEVRINGEEKDVLPVYGDFMGCVAGSGESEILFTFYPASLRRGILLSLIGLALSALFGGALFVAAYRRSRTISANMAR